MKHVSCRWSGEERHGLQLQSSIDGWQAVGCIRWLRTVVAYGIVVVWLVGEVRCAITGPQATRWKMRRRCVGRRGKLLRERRGFAAATLLSMEEALEICKRGIRTAILLVLHGVVNG